MTLQELVNETLTQKSRRLRQEKCVHPEIYCSSVTRDGSTFETSVCLDCGKTWRRGNGGGRATVTITIEPPSCDWISVAFKDKRRGSLWLCKACGSRAAKRRQPDCPCKPIELPEKSRY